jgi:cytochrome o ubiquinol oxidase operon protein cyoD
MNHEPTDYFAEIGFWPEGTRLRTYLWGFFLSLLFTFIPFALLEIHIASHHRTFSHETLLVCALAFALLQFVTQAAFFLHLVGKEASRERLAIFAAAAVVVAILVGGSIWIMTNLNGRMMADPAHMMEYMQQEDAF